jgi:CRP-like cAMP-binding protein
MMSDTRILIFDKSSHFITYNAGETIFLEGEAAEPMYVIQDGEVELILHENIIETIGPGEFFGEMAMITGEPHTGTARAKTNIRLVPVDKTRFLFMVQETPNFAVAVMKVLIERLARVNTELSEALRKINPA